MNHKFDGNCIYFPIVDTEFQFFYDENGVKHKKDTGPYICPYNDKKINFRKECKNYLTYDMIKEGEKNGDTEM